MIKDEQVKRMLRLMKEKPELSFSCHAAQSGMSEPTARKYVRLGALPSTTRQAHTWQTRKDSFSEVWPELETYLEANPGLEAKTLFDYLQRRYPGRFQDGQLRTLQRRLKRWRALAGPEREVYFTQQHKAGVLCQSDFTHMDSLGVTIDRTPFSHMAYHFVLAYSGWESCTVCFSESFESLSLGFQNALWNLGGVPLQHCTDRFSAAVSSLSERTEFTERYRGLMKHYGISCRYINTAKPNENGCVEQRNNRFKRAVEQALMLRGSRDFSSRVAYELFLSQLLKQMNAGRSVRLAEETRCLRTLPASRLDAQKRLHVRVGVGSTISVDRNVYSVPSRLIGETVEVRMDMETVEAWYAQKLVERMPRLRGRNRHHINYRHIIGWLVRKPGAFAQYRYRSELFPTSHFRMAYDLLCQGDNARADKEYLRLLKLASDNESAVDHVLAHLIGRSLPIAFENVEAMVRDITALASPAALVVAPVALAAYDALLSGDVLSQAKESAS
jgi:hypothetical protein